MNKEDRQSIQAWTVNVLDSGDRFDESFALLISISKE